MRDQVCLSYCGENLEDQLPRCGSEKELIERGYKEDVLLAAELNVSACVPTLTDGAYIAG